MIDRLKKLTTVQVWLLSVAISVVLTEFVVGIMGVLLKGEVTHDYLLTGLAASLSAACLVVSLLTILIQHVAKIDASLRLQSRITSEAAEGVVLVRAADGEIIYANHHCHEMFGYGLGGLVGQHFSAVNASTDASPEEITNQIMRSLKKNGVWNGELLSRKKDGTTFRTFAQISNFHDDEHGNLWVTYQSDVSTQKRMMLALADSQRHYATLLATSPVGVIETDMDGKCTYINERWTEITGMSFESVREDGWAIGLHPKDKDAVFTEWAASVAENRLFHLEFRFRRPDGSVTWVLGQGDTLRSESCETLGYIGTITDITERKNIENALRDSESHFRSLFMQASIPMVLCGKTNVIEALNAKFVETYGYTREDIPNLDAWWPRAYPGEAYRAENSAAWLEAVDKAIQYGTPIPPKELRIVCKDGTVRTAIISGSFIGHQFLVTFSDITELRLAEETLRRSEERWKFALEGSGDGVWDVNLETQETVYSKRYQEMLGYTEGELIGIHSEWLDLIHPEDKPHVMEAVQDYLDGKSDIYATEYRLRCKGGNYKWIYARGKVVSRTTDGKPLRMVGTHTDFTERKHAEELLEASERNYRILFESANDGIFIQNASGFIDCNRKAAEMYGLAKEEVIGRLPSDFAPERQPNGRRSSEVAAEKIMAAMRGETPCFEWRPLRADGVPFDVEVKLSQVEYRDQPCLMAIVRDITERKRTEETLRLANLVYENTSESMFVTEADGTIVAVNPAFTRTTGYTSEETLGNNPRMLASGKHDSAFFQKLWASLSSVGRWQGEIWNRRKNGELFAEHLTINTIFHDDGTPWRHVALFLDITEKKASEELLWKQAYLDTLTGLPNRRLLQDRLSREIKKSVRTGLPLALLLLDLDHFKEVNDTLGHEMGDELLRETARRLANCVRDTDTVARQGGDEFTIILGELESTESLDRIAYALLSSLTQPYRLGLEIAYVSVSIGITLYPNDASDPFTLIKNADQAMYAAKSEGRNRFCYFTRAMQQAAEHRLRLANDIRSATAHCQFEVHYQPIVELATGNVHKAEALIRWKHPSKGMISPAQFIPIAEDTGLIHAIGEWVFKEALAQVKRFRERCHPRFQISVNRSPVQFRPPTSSFKDWDEYMRDQDLPGESVVVEITETLLMDARESVRLKLLKFRDAGIQVAIDDFGTGYSALSYLKKFDIDYLKIDTSFTRNLFSHSSDLALCEAIVVMAHKLGLKVIAEGVETQEQRDMLMHIGCDYGQGYWFARPMAADEFEQWLMAFRVS